MRLEPHRGQAAGIRDKGKAVGETGKGELTPVGFRKLQGVGLPESKQGLIYYTCLNYAEQPKHVRRKIERLCQSAGGEYAPALFELVTSPTSVTATASKWHLSEETLKRLRRSFYRSW